MGTRRSQRQQLLGTSAIHRARLVIDGPAQALKNPALSAYLKPANLLVQKVATNRPLMVELALFSQFGVARVVGPQTTVLWPRDSASKASIVAVMVRTGGVEAKSETPALRSDPGLLLIPPGDTPVEIQLTGEDNDFLLINAPVDFLNEAGLTPRLEHALRGGADAPRNRVDESLILPSMMFLMALCRVSVRPEVEISPLQRSAIEVAKSVLSLIIGQQAAPLGLFARAMEVILSDYTNAELTVEMIATRLGVSVRTLQLAFRAEGTTCKAELRGVRVRAAQQMRLANEDVSYAAVARAVGFGSESAMYRALRQAPEFSPE